MNSVRAYLLGTLPEKQAEAVEQKYFTDPAFFEQVRDAEQALIEDFLNHRLRPEENALFETRYLRLPELQKLVDDARLRLSNARPARTNRRLWQLAAGGVVVAGLGAGFLTYTRSEENLASPPAVAGNRQTGPTVIATLNLEPGLVMDAAGRTPDIKVRSGNFAVRINAELPGQRLAVERVAAISRVSPDGSWAKIWTSSGPVLSTSSPTGHQISLTVETRVLAAGDYVLQLATGGGQITDSYVFRVSASE